MSFRAASLVLLASALASVTIATALKAKPKAASIAKPQAIAADELQLLAARRLLMPVKGYDTTRLRDTYEDSRGTKRRHHALDIMAPRGTPVLAVDDGPIAKLDSNPAGGITAYQYDSEERFAYYYAHLDRYATGLREGDMMKRGQVLGYVGSTGNAPARAPHLHFAIFQLGPEKQWWKGTAVNPYPYLAAAR